jgi:hypothetical protein
MFGNENLIYNEMKKKKTPCIYKHILSLVFPSQSYFVHGFFFKINTAFQLSNYRIQSSTNLEYNPEYCKYCLLFVMNLYNASLPDRASAPINFFCLQCVDEMLKNTSLP